ncbi:protein PLANT CADMIUM RESISTANCE 11-like isoform X2 [Fagus crenata]
MGRTQTWSTGLFDCTSDTHSCCLTCWCPCVTFGQVSEILDQRSSTCFLNGAIYALFYYPSLSIFGPFYSWCYRSKLRKQYISEEENCCEDFCVHLFCGHCALCQEYRELQNRGFDVSAGWKGNPHMHNKGVAMTPVVEGGMKR